MRIIVFCCAYVKDISQYKCHNVNSSQFLFTFLFQHLLCLLWTVLNNMVWHFVQPRSFISSYFCGDIPFDGSGHFFIHCGDYYHHNDCGEYWRPHVLVAYYIKCCLSCQPCNGEYIQIVQIEKVPEKYGWSLCVDLILILVHSLIAFCTCYILALQRLVWSHRNCDISVSLGHWCSVIFVEISQM